MVYKIVSDRIGRAASTDNRYLHRHRASRYTGSGQSIAKSGHSELSHGSWLATLLIAVIKFYLFFYDILSFPIYYIIFGALQDETNVKFRVEKVDSCTWMKTGPACLHFRSASDEPELDQNLSSEQTDANNIIQTGTIPKSDRCTKSKYKFNRRGFRHLGRTLDEIFRNAVEVFADQPCLGYRAVITCPVMEQDETGKSMIVEKSFRSDFTWYTFDQVGRRVLDLASGLHNAGLRRGQGAFCLVSEPSLEWFCAAQACFQLGVHLVVAPELSDKPSLSRALSASGVQTVLTCCGRLPLLADLLECNDHHLSDRVVISPAISGSDKPNQDELYNGQKIHRDESIQLVIVTDWQFRVDDSEPVFEQFIRRTKHLIPEDRLLSLCQVEESGVDMCSSFSQPPQLGPIRWASLKDHLDNQPIDEHELALVIYGHSQVAGRTSRLPLSHRYLARSHHHLFLDSGLAWLWPQFRPSDDQFHQDSSSDSTGTGSCCFGSNLRHCATQPLDNLLELMLELWVFSRGGSIGYSLSSEQTLLTGSPGLFDRDKSDLEALDPSHLLVRPYQLEQLRAALQAHLSLHLNPLKSFLLVNLVCGYKQRWSAGTYNNHLTTSNWHYRTPLLNRMFCGPLKRLFGTRIRCILCDGRADCPQTKQFFALVLNLPVIELYGPPEAVASLISGPNVSAELVKLPLGGSISPEIDLNNQFGDPIQESQSLFVSADSNYPLAGLPFDPSSLQTDEEQIEDYFDHLQLLPAQVDSNVSFRQDTSVHLFYLAASILVPTLGTRVRLEDWQDFRQTDKPFPRGRLLIGGHRLVADDMLADPSSENNESNYIERDSDSKKISWLRTDDIVRLFPQSGSVEIISSISDMIRMHDGQLVSLSQVEHILRGSQFVDNVCAICADDRQFVVALVVPNLRRLARKSFGSSLDSSSHLQLEPEPEELIDLDFRREVCNDRLMCQFVAEHLATLLERGQLDRRRLQIEFHLVAEIWSPESELATPNKEPKRAELKKFYASELASIMAMRLASRSPRPGCSSRAGRLSARRAGRKSPNRYNLNL